VQTQSSSSPRSEQAARQAQHMVDAAFATDETIHLFVVPDKPGDPLPDEMTEAEVSFSRDQRLQAIRWTKLALRARWAVFRSKTKAAPPKSEPEPPGFDPPPHIRATKSSGRGIGTGDEPSPWREINDRAMAHFERWVPKLFPAAVKTASGGYRVSSKSLGRNLQEDISIAPEGICDFGVADMGDPDEGRRSPIALVMEWLDLEFLPAMRWLEKALLLRDTEEPGSEAPKDEKPEQAAPAILKWIDMARWDSEPAPPREWAIRDRAPRRQAGLFSGEGGTGKSIIEMMKNVCHVAGKEWLGAMPTRGPAFYVGCEDEEDEFHRRFEAIAEHYGVTFKQLIDGGLMALCKLWAKTRRYARSQARVARSRRPNSIGTCTRRPAISSRSTFQLTPCRGPSPETRSTACKFMLSACTCRRLPLSRTDRSRSCRIRRLRASPQGREFQDRRHGTAHFGFGSTSHRRA
jgi:AAA domain